MKKLSTTLLATMVAMAASVASAATYTTEVRVDFDKVKATGKFQTACSTGTDDSCDSSISGSTIGYLEAFDTSLGTLNSLTLTFGVGMAGSYILRGDNVVAPNGFFSNSASARNSFYTKRSTTSQNFTDGVFSNSTVKSFDVGGNGRYVLTATESASDDDALRFNSTEERSAFQSIAAGNQNEQLLKIGFAWNLTSEIKEDAACDGSRFIVPDVNPCGATNRLSGLRGGLYSTASLVTPNTDFWWARGVYDYTPTVVTPPVSEVPLPASSLLLLGGLGGLAALRRRKKS